MLDETFQASLVAVRGMHDDLPAQKAVLGRDVALIRIEIFADSSLPHPE
ncbi:hypothetical protein [Streptomyces sp. NPDC057301]